ncbi:hypothetical protein B0H17DRAFT_1201926 [Mycena rosella]|uniref:Cytochrome P450 n=1 Tax=Mycena rosella TaxID=1033263 RepID=A0AAD7GE27_MYCRO|nr:hypothetical protein B0H17DRAFT_1201926 [Mycena rosella]
MGLEEISSLVLGTIALLSFLHLQRQRHLRLPPGPPKLPLIGNLLAMPSHCRWDAFAKWSKEFAEAPAPTKTWNTLLIMAASVLAAFDITKTVGEDGAVIESLPGHTSELSEQPFLLGFNLN